MSLCPGLGYAGQVIVICTLDSIYSPHDGLASYVIQFEAVSHPLTKSSVRHHAHRLSDLSLSCNQNNFLFRKIYATFNYYTRSLDFNFYFNNLWYQMCCKSSDFVLTYISDTQKTVLWRVKVSSDYSTCSSITAFVIKILDLSPSRTIKMKWNKISISFFLSEWVHCTRKQNEFERLTLPSGETWLKYNVNWRSTCSNRNSLKLRKLR